MSQLQPENRIGSPADLLLLHSQLRASRPLDESRALCPWYADMPQGEPFYAGILVPAFPQRSPPSLQITSPMTTLTPNKKLTHDCSLSLMAATTRNALSMNHIPIVASSAHGPR
jgi:hypothetical protein